MSLLVQHVATQPLTRTKAHSSLTHQRRKRLQPLGSKGAPCSLWFNPYEDVAEAAVQVGRHHIRFVLDRPGERLFRSKLRQPGAHETRPRLRRETGGAGMKVAARCC
jgi:hypothetical protein